MAGQLEQIMSAVNAASAQVQRATRRLSVVVGRLDALGSRAIRSAAVALPALPAGVAVDVALAWAAPMPDTSYQVFPSVAGGPVLVAGQLQLTVKLGTRTVDGISVTVTNTSTTAIADAAGVLWALAVNPSA